MGIKTNVKILKASILFTAVLALFILLAPFHVLAAGPVKGGALRVAASADPPSFDSHTATTAAIQVHTAAVFNGLVRTDSMKEEVTIDSIVPDLARSWEKSPDGKVYTFHLRKGIKFHDGHPFTAEDVKHSLDKFRDPKRSAFAENIEPIDKVEVVDDLTVKVYLKHAYPQILLFLCPPYASIQPAHLANVNPKTVQFLVGTGPFKYKSHVPGKVFVYERNPDYFIEGMPYLDEYRVYIMGIPAIMDAFVGGRLDCAANLRMLLDTSRDYVLKIQKHAPEATIAIAPAGAPRGIFFGLKRKGPWQDVRVRKAMAMVIDYEGTITAAVGGPELKFVPAAGIVPIHLKEALPIEEVQRLFGINLPLESRIAKAKELMKEAGFPDGFDGECIARAEEAQYVRPSIFAADLWKRYLNINITVKPLERAAFFDRRDQSAFDLCFEATTASTGVSALEFLSIFLIKNTRNFGKWSNKEYEELVEKMRTETDQREAIALARKAQTIFYEEMPHICFHASTYGTAFRPDLRTGWPPKKGVVIQPTYTNFPSIDRIWLEGTAERWTKAK